MSIHKLRSLGSEVNFQVPDLRSLSGLAEKGMQSLQSAGIFDLIDLLLRIPKKYDDRRKARCFADIFCNNSDQRVFTEVTVLGIDYFFAKGRRTARIQVHDGSASAYLHCFGRPFLAKKLCVGSRWLLAANCSFRKGELQASSFEVEAISETSHFFAIVPEYRSVSGLFAGKLRSLYEQCLAIFRGQIIDTIPEQERASAQLPELAWAIEHIHRPENLEDIEQARRRLAYGELRYIFLSNRNLARSSRQKTSPTKVEHRTSNFSPLQNQLISSLDFSLTSDQITCIREINSDISDENAMHRLLQGDVGTGKTLVALCGALRILESGGQVAFMVPTELLANQHSANITKLLKTAGLLAKVPIRLFIAGLSTAERQKSMSAMEAGDQGIWIGTHSLFAEAVIFKKLQLVIIDEQHRFGVNQREDLARKASTKHILMLSATPIPRTLTLTLFGNMEISTIRMKPEGRLPVQTHLAAIGKEEKVYAEVEKHLQDGRQVYFVYPRIEGGVPNSAIELKAAEQMFEILKQRFQGQSIGILHGRMSMQDRQAEIEAFASGRHSILVATTVIEVGVDIPNASVIVIEHAERFGLAALHQLRGRVGRSGIQSYCYLVYEPSLSEEGKKRLRVMKEIDDGFELAESDLRIRGPGNIVGIEQSGYLNLEFASLYNDLDLIEILAQNSR